MAPNAYYNFLKNRKADYCTQKQEVLEKITEIYHEHNGVDGYRSMKVYLERKGHSLSNLTVHKYMKNITANLAIRTLKKALESQKNVSPDLILHSDQGSQYTSKEFIEFFASSGVTQSMSKAGYPYDSAPLERYRNPLKNELIYLHYYHNDEELNSSIEEFTYVTYNHIRPHSYNGYKTPFEARYTSIGKINLILLAATVTKKA